MEWFLKVVRDNYANFDGRARRKEYWMFFLFNIFFSIVANIIDSIIGVPALSGILMLALLVPGIAVSIRRMHDIGNSGWMLLIGFVPLIGGIWLIILMAKEGDKGSNEYGEDPKGGVADANSELLDA